MVCAVYNYEDHATEFQLIENREERDKSIGSKYMQSKPGKIYKIAEDWLINHPEKRLLFVGMGCQADGFRKFAEMKGFRERVWIVDIICHGSPSPRLWKEYAESAEKKYGKITYLTFKDKRNGWKAPTAYVTAGGQEHLIKDSVICNGSNKGISQNSHKHPDCFVRAVWILAPAFILCHVLLSICI